MDVSSYKTDLDEGANKCTFNKIYIGYSKWKNGFMQVVG